MTNAELEQQIAELENEKSGLTAVIESQQQQIIDFQAIAREVVTLRDENADLSQRCSALQAQIDTAQGSGQFMELGRGWIHTAIGQRVMTEPTIDTAPFLLGVMAGDFLMIQDTYRFILKRLHELAKPATEVEMQEITDLLIRTGFASAPAL